MFTITATDIGKIESYPTIGSENKDNTVIIKTPAIITHRINPCNCIKSGISTNGLYLTGKFHLLLRGMHMRAHRNTPSIDIKNHISFLWSSIPVTIDRIIDAIKIMIPIPSRMPNNFKNKSLLLNKLHF